jgi:hypothetical protein
MRRALVPRKPPSVDLHEADPENKTRKGERELRGIAASLRNETTSAAFRQKLDGNRCETREISMTR